MKMAFFDEFKFSFRFFYILGQTPYCPKNSKFGIRAKYLMYWPIVFQVIVTVSTLVLCLRKTYISSLGFGFMAFYMSKFAALAIPNWMKIYETLMQPFGVLAINDKLLFICDVLCHKLKAPFQMKQFKVEYNWNCFVFIALFVLYLIVVLCIPIYGRDVELSGSIMKLFELTAILHALFYINSFKFILIALNEYTSVESSTISHVLVDPLDRNHHDQNTLTHLKRLRFVHLKLWEVMALFQNQFGWRLVGFLADSSLTLTTTTNSLVFLCIHSKSITSDIIREYRNVLFV